MSSGTGLEIIQTSRDSPATKPIEAMTTNAAMAISLFISILPS